MEAENEPPFLISLIDHKSLVDYDVAMQLLRYMMCIWTAYKKELEAKHEGITRRKEFRYPVIIPIVYFEGEAKWTAARNFRERIRESPSSEQFLRLPADRLNRIVKDSPEHVIDIIVSAMESLCFKIDVSAEERLKCVRKVRERKMGYLWENMEKISIQEERRKTEEQRKLAEKERCRADEAEEKLKAAEEMIRQLKDNIGSIE